MKHRIFIAINLPDSVRKELLSFSSHWPELPCRWTKKENLHITLTFLGYLSDDEVLKVLKVTEEVARRNSSFFITLNKIIYAPPQKIPPRMIWAVGDPPKEMCLLKEDLDQSLTHAGIPFISEREKFLLHVTLGRIRTWEWRQIEPEERPDISEDISLNFRVNSIEAMESRLKRGGAEYTVLKSYPLSERD